MFWVEISYLDGDFTRFGPFSDRGAAERALEAACHKPSLKARLLQRDTEEFP